MLYTICRFNIIIPVFNAKVNNVLRNPVRFHSRLKIRNRNGWITWDVFYQVMISRKQELLIYPMVKMSLWRAIMLIGV
jgi:hypothetical protein